MLLTEGDAMSKRVMAAVLAVLVAGRGYEGGSLTFKVCRFARDASVMVVIHPHL